MSNEIITLNDALANNPLFSLKFVTKVLEETSFKGALIRDSNLEDVFLKLAGRSLKD